MLSTPARTRRSAPKKAVLQRTQAIQILQTLFGHADFHDRQWELIDHLFQRKRVLSIERTGFGKSLVFQFAATQLPGLTLVFSPLVALMHDQVHALESRGIAAAFLNHTQSASEQKAVLDKVQRGGIKLLYVAPERDADRAWELLLKTLPLSMVVIDEAHCVSVWGHDFRPAYRRISEVVARLPVGTPLFACTSTATQRTEEDICRQLGSGNAHAGIEIVRGDLSRANLKTEVVIVEPMEDKDTLVLRRLRQELHEGSTGLVYVGTRKEAERFAVFLHRQGIEAVYYHGGMNGGLRRSVEEQWKQGRFKVVVSTNALGMGIDKPDIRFVYHLQIPASPLHYYQEIGRAGRDGLPASAVLFYHPKDDRLIQRFIDTAQPAKERYLRCIEALSQGFSEWGLQRKLRLGEDTWRTMKQELLDQGILALHNGKAVYQQDHPAFQTLHLENLRLAKLSEFEAMKRYIQWKGDRMKFLVLYLGQRR
ncbi:RecQ family ATP-dependent DNA helicase [bacterium]|nr:RecQ family ATP-dependent DNA helicase [bacterium]